MIEIFAFAGFKINIAGRWLTLKNRKAQALLIYLASHQDQSHERAVLAEMFWPDLPEATARNNLSKALGQISEIFLPADDALPLLETTRHTISMAGSAGWQLDANRFSGLVKQGGSYQDADESAAFLDQAVSLYQGEFLAGFSLADCPTFEGWLLLQRESLMLMARDSYQSLAEFHLERGDFKQAQKFARSQLALDAWHEEAHRQLMRALHGMGLRNDALTQYEACRQILRSELGLEPEQATRTLFEQIKSAETKTELPDHSQTPIARLPKRLLPLVGREGELDELLTDLKDPSCRMLTIAGVGGVGKTSLALEAAWQAAPNFRDGAVFVNLEGLQLTADTDLHEQLAISIGTALEMTFSGKEKVQQQLYRVLGNQEMLLLMDNLEHLITASSISPVHSVPAFVTELLNRAPAVKVLATSREMLAIPAEVVLVLNGLPVPKTDQTLATIAEYSSVRFFVGQAQRIQREFRLGSNNFVAVAEICRLVDGLPLAIEMAARWATHFSCAEIAAAIKDNLDFLAAERLQPTQRHQSVRAAFAYSWRMLTPGEQKMLAQLSIIPAQFSREGALRITEGSLGNLVTLQSKSLLRLESPGTYSLHQLLRQFAREELKSQTAEELQALHRRYADFYLHELARHGEGFDQEWPGEAIKAIERDIENIRSAWQTAMELDIFDSIDQALQPLYHYYRIQGLFHEGRKLFEQAVATFRSKLEKDNGNRLLLDLLGRSLLRQGRYIRFLADSEQAMPLLREGLEYLQRLGDGSDLPRGHAYLGEALLRAGHINQAKPHLDKALTLYRQNADENGIALALELQASCASQAGHFEEADRFFKDSVAHSRRTGNKRMEGRSLHDWAVQLIQRGQVGQAAELLRESQNIARELDLRMPIAFNQCMLARTDRHFGYNERARRRLQNSLRVLEGSGYVFYTIRALNLLGEVLAILGQTEEASASLEKALSGLKRMETDVITGFEYLVLDFLVAASFLFTYTEREPLADHYLQVVLKYVDPETDLDHRARQLQLALSKSEFSLERSGFMTFAVDDSITNVLNDFQL